MALASATVALVLTQVIYPVNYGAFLDWFNGRSADSSLFWLNAGRNVLWLALAGLVLEGWWRQSRRQQTTSAGAAQ